MTRRTTQPARSCILVLTGIAAVICGVAISQAQSHPEPPGHEPSTVGAKPSTTNQSSATQPAAETKAGANRAASQRSDPEPRREPSPTEILRELTKPSSAAPRPVVRPVTPGQHEVRRLDPSALPANAVATVTPKLLPDGYRLVDRPGRLAREGDYWVFTFENRSRGDAEMPIRLLPNRLLEDMEMVSEGGARDVVFVISGEITEYHGVNYLLIQKLLTRPNLGNLG